MAAGLIGSITITTANTWQLAATLPAETFSFNVHICNRAKDTASITVAPLSTSNSAPLSNEEFESEVLLSPSSSLPITGLVSGGAAYVMVKSSQIGVSVNVYGI